MSKVELTGRAPALSLRVDDRDVYATEVDIHADARSIPTVTVKLDIIEDVVLAIAANVVIPPHTRESLIALGWTPPQ